MQGIETTPIACTLEAGALASRLTEIQAFTSAYLLTHEMAGRVLRLKYRVEAVQELRRIVELERRCCAFLEFDIAEARDSVVLTVSAPADALDSARWLFEQFMPAESAPAEVAPCGCARTLGDCRSPSQGAVS
jgi:hypothetical protein